MSSHVIDYKIEGEEMQFVEIELDPQESVIAESGSFMMMDSGITMSTIFGDGSGQSDQDNQKVCLENYFLQEKDYLQERACL